MNVSGLTKEQLDHIAELEEMERQILDKVHGLAPELVAQGLTCLAHDYVELFLTEKCGELLLLADKICPNYYIDILPRHIKNDSDYALLIKRLSLELIFTILTVTKYG